LISKGKIRTKVLVKILNLFSSHSLDSFFYITQLDYKNDKVSTTQLSDIDIDEPFSWFNFEEAKFLFQSAGHPEELNVSHILTIQFIKSHGEIVSSETPPIT